MLAFSPWARCVEDQIGGSRLALGVISVHKPRENLQSSVMMQPFGFSGMA